MPLNINQRYEDPHEALLTAMDGQQAEMWTAIPGIIQSYDATKLIVTVQPSIQALYTGGDLSQKFVNLPILPDVPVVFPRGGGYTLTYPIKAGDECLCVFSSRCIDSWWDQGGIQPQRELRMHDLSDGFALVGPFSQKTKIQNVSTTTVQLRTDKVNGSQPEVFVEIDEPNKKAHVTAMDVIVELDGTNHNINMTAPQQININADTINITGTTVINMKAPTINEN